MCGIAGFVDAQAGGDKRENEALLDKMCELITHRGPDEQGMAQVGRANLGMRRLSIIDLKSGQQPIFSTDKSKFIVFNGEIYNYQSLKSELESLGYQFQTNSDTETIIHAFDEFGVECLSKLRGMFAFSIWDEKEQRLFIARDRVGKKPLFYGFTEAGRFVFGSEVKSILAHEGISREICPDALNAYVTFGYVPEELCIFKNIKKLPPGCYLTLKEGELRIEEYWDFEYNAEIEEIPDTELERRLLEEIEEAVKVRLVSEVPLGAFLSGGVDSSAVVGLMSKLLDKPVKTFSIGFNEDSFSELKYARIAAKHFDTEHHEFTVTPDLVDMVDDLVWHFDEPFSDPSSLPTYMVSKMAKDYVTVVLSGDGGDELFAGYSRYVDHKGSGLQALPETLKSGLLRPLSKALPHSAPGKNYLYNSSFSGVERYIDSVSQFGSSKKSRLFSREFLANFDGRADLAEDLFLKIASKRGELDEMTRILYLDAKTYLPSDILTKVDRMSMAASLEARVPLLDQKLISFVARHVPFDKKLNGSETKYVFKKVLEGMVPEEILYREKQGFGVPIGEWINTKLRKTIINTLLEKRTLERGYFERKYIETIVEEHSKGRRDHGHPLWVLWILELWHRKYIDT